MPERCVEELRAAELILHAGDFTAVSVLRWLEGLGPPVESVHGNMDDAELRAELPRRHVVEVEGARLGLVHDPGPARGRAERLTGAFPGCVAVVYGHTHLPEIEQTGGLWLLNPGSATWRRRAPFHSMLRVEVTNGLIEPRLIELT